jgi:hypothetical protein
VFAEIHDRQGYAVDYVRGTPEQIERLFATAEVSTDVHTIFDLPVVVADSNADRMLAQHGRRSITLRG